MRTLPHLGLVLCAAAFAHALQPPAPDPRFFGTFSSFRNIPAAGDTLGYELSILPNRGHPFVLFRCAIGAPETPVHVDIHFYSQSGEFQVPKGQSSCSGIYLVTLTADGLRLRSRQHASAPARDLPDGLLHRNRTAPAFVPEHPP